MNSKKIHILFPFRDGPWGGGNQFLSSLRKELRKRDLYVESVREAEIILFNSHHSLNSALFLRLLYPKKIFIHRVDGPIQYLRPGWNALDKLIFEVNNLIADGTIFQSEWSKSALEKLGFVSKSPSTVIHNAVDTAYFFSKADRSLTEKIQLISTSWSSNEKKGFDIYRELDERLDPALYEMTFIGNAPAHPFKQIRVHPPLSRELLGEALRKHDIYLTASIDDPCSNALLEGLACGLPALVRNSGGHPELVQNGGEVFNTCDELFEHLTNITKNYEKYRGAIKTESLATTTEQYVNFVSNIKRRESLQLYKFSKLLLTLCFLRLQGKIQN